MGSSGPGLAAPAAASARVRFMARHSSGDAARMVLRSDPMPAMPLRPLARSPGGRSAAAALLAVAVLGTLVLSSLASAGGGIGGGSPGPAPTSPAALSSAAPPGGERSPAGVSNDVPCYSLNATICVSVTNSSVPNIIPVPGSHVSATEPLANATINLWVRSVYSLVWPGNVPTSGPHSPLSLNATGVLWNGVRYYNDSDGTVWHPTGNVWWSFGPTNLNKSYPFYYGLTFSPKSASGSPNFFPGMTLTWWIYFVQNTSNVFTHWTSVALKFTFGGAWPASPYPSAPQYGGSSAAAQDLAVSQSPPAPNYNDSVSVSISTTPLDLLSSATIGGAYLDLTESAPNGAVLNATTLSFPVTVRGSQGAVGSTLLLPPTLALSPGALVSYRVTAWDTSEYNPLQVGPDLIVSALFNYTVHGNGSFANGNFSNDLALSTDPVASSTLSPGATVEVNLSSKNPGTAIEAAELNLNFTYTGLGETVPVTVPFHRENSTHFAAAIPPLPLGAAVRFQVSAWDFAQTRETSTVESYTVEDLNHLLPTVPANSTFFVVYVYDNGPRQWVSNARVDVIGLASLGYVFSSAQTFGGVAYPNATGKPFVPLLLPAGTSYRIQVTDPTFLPTGAFTAPTVNVTVEMPHAPTRSGVLVVGTDYIIAESGPAIYFWLNQTYSPVTYSAPTPFGTGAVVGAALGLAALTVTGLPLVVWWSSIRARRAEQERRITL